MNEELKVVITAETDKLKKGVEDATKKVRTFKDQVKDAAKNCDANFKTIGESVKTAMLTVATTVAAAGVALLALGASTEEYRVQQAQLKTAFEAAGGSAEAATATYNSLYRVLGDSGRAQEAAQQLAKLTTNERALNDYTRILKGTYAQFGDALSAEGLAEAINHTAKLGSVQGNLADALEWSGINVDTFNEQLAACHSETQREALIRGTLNKLYGEAADMYETNNAKVLAQRDAQIALQAQTAKLGEAVAPVITAFTTFAADALAVIVPYIEQLAAEYMPLLESALTAAGEQLGVVMAYLTDNWDVILTIAGVIGGIAAAIGLYNTVAAVKAAIAALEVSSVWGLVAAYAAQAVAMMAALAPYLLIIAAVAALVAGFLYLWNNCEGFREFFINLWETLKTVFHNFVESLKPLIQTIVDTFKEAWELIKVVWDIVKPYFEGLWNAIKVVFSVVKDVLSGYFKAAWEVIKSVWSVVVAYFTAIWNTIKNVFSVVKNVLSGNFQGAWDAIKNIFSGWGAFFTNLWTNVKNIFGNVASAIGNAITSTVKGAVNAVLSTAAGIINGFISAINVAIGIINAIPGVSISKLNKLNVPQMAQGGVVDSATLAVIGERGSEAVVPLENNLQWLDKLAGMLNERMGGGTSQQIVLQVDGKTFAETTLDCLNQHIRQTGSLALVMP